jgi:uncharacterized protein
MTPEIRLPSLELLDTMHTFPGPFVFKIIGDSHDDFIGDALTLAMSALNHERECHHTSRKSSAGNHTSLTLTVHIESTHEVHLIYEKLLGLTGLRMLF